MARDSRTTRAVGAKAAADERLVPLDRDLMARAWHRAFHRHKDYGGERCNNDAAWSDRVAAEYDRLQLEAS